MPKKSNKKARQTQWEIFWEPLTRFQKRWKATENKKESTTNYKILVIVTVLLPFAAWALGASMNPTGWLSHNPIDALYLSAYTLGLYWFITVPVIVLFAFIVYGVRKKSATTLKAIAIFFFIISLIYSILILTAVQQAESSEFTD